ncbi:uncharacterized protein C2845_PM15G25100 [Panicum miliaceum]|uniref:Uncharacterized protein n=1 Tax=Panicum miliaceum TaxID=4540 RepID=A0A3L6Q5K5_PANMI|nr:uncharacterized protein C2845_PM15G25100 [Panicum miliaceum]
MASLRESKSWCLKRKLFEDSQSKECKSRRIKAENGPSFDSSAKRCNCCCIRPNLANDCVNFLKSGVPKCIMYYKQGSWHNFPEQIMKFLIEEFSGNKSSVVSVMDGDPVLIDFLSMTMVNLTSRKQQSVAWIDDSNKCFSPSLFFDEEIDDMVKGDAANAQGTVQGIMLDRAVNSPPEVVKQVVVESSLPASQEPSNADILRKKIISVERGSKDFLFVQDLFLSGMTPFATQNNLLRVYRYTPNDITAQCRLQAFERQIVSTKEKRGDANVRYGWLGSRKNDIVRILINGLGTTGKPAEKADLSAGVYLSPENRTFTSVGLCDVDEKGVQYILLCQVILGNTEAVEPGSQEFFPSSDIYDSGVDDCLNPKCYVMWPSHLSTHTRLEYLVSFKLSPDVRSYLLHLKGLWFRPSPKEVAADISTLQPYYTYPAEAICPQASCEIGEGPTTPWISFKVLFGLVQDNISSIARELLFHHYEELKESKITREEMVRKMMIIVGKKILLEALNKLHYCPSLWYKSSVKAVSSDPATLVASEQLSLNETSRDALIGNHVDSHPPISGSEHSGALRAKGCGALPTDIVPKGHDCPTPCAVSKISNSAAAKCPVSQGVESKGNPRQVISLGNYATRFARYQDPIVTRMPPISRDGLLGTTSRISASPGMEVCSSVSLTTGLPGCASPARTNTSKSPAILAPGFSPSLKGYESVVPTLALGNSKGAGSKCLNSALMTPGGQEFLSLSIASRHPVPHSVKGPDSSTSAARPPLYAPGRRHSPSVSTGPCDSLTLSMTAKGNDPSASRAETKGHEYPTAAITPESHRPQAMDAATKVQNAPKPITGELKDQAAQNKLPGPGLEGSSHAVRASDTPAALSTPQEKGER